MTEDQIAILEVLAGQSPGYDAFPNASCFVAAGYRDPEVVSAILLELEQLGHTMQYVYDTVEKTPQEVYAELPDEEKAKFHTEEPAIAAADVAWPEPVLREVPGGFEITDEGRAARTAAS